MKTEIRLGSGLGESKEGEVAVGNPDDIGEVALKKSGDMGVGWSIGICSGGD